MRAAVLYGAWSAFCLLAAFTLVLLLPNFDWKRLQAANTFVVVNLTGLTLIVGFAGWLLLHRSGRRPGGAAYALMAIGVVVTVHLAFMCITILPVFFEGPVGFEPIYFARMVARAFAIHAWFTLPAALVATAAFVAALRWRTGKAAG